MLLIKALRLCLISMRELGGIPFNVAIFLFLFAKALDVSEWPLPPGIASYTRWANLGLFAVCVLFFAYGYIRSRWLRKAVLWVALIDKIKHKQPYDPDWLIWEWQKKSRRYDPAERYPGGDLGGDVFAGATSALFDFEKPKKEPEAEKGVRLDEIQTHLESLIGSVESGDRALKQANDECKRFIAQAKEIVDASIKKGLEQPK